MSYVGKTCWGMLGIMTIGSFQPAVWAASPEIAPVVRTTPRLAAEPSLANILSGSNIPTSIKLKELTPEWRAMSTNGQLEIGNLQAFIGLWGGGAFATNYYTKGQTVVVGSETYIVAYSLLSLADKISPEMPLSLSLLNLKTIGSMSNIRAFEPIAETKLLEKQLTSLQTTNMFTPPTGGDKPTDEVPPPQEEPSVTPGKVKSKSTIRKKRSIRKTTPKRIRKTTRKTVN
jgi:hypothetical protein